MTEHPNPNRIRPTRQGRGPSRTGCLPPAALPSGQTMMTIAAISGLPDCVAFRPCCAALATRAGARPAAAVLQVAPVDVMRCRIVWRLVTELFTAICGQDLSEGAARRRSLCHRRQVAMYLSHVVLSVPYRSIAIAFGRDRTTVVHACSVTEDRRDDAGYDHFIERCERCIEAVFAPFGQDHAGL